MRTRKYRRWCHGPRFTKGKLRIICTKRAYIDCSSSLAERLDDRRQALVRSGGETQHADQHYHHILRDCEETETGVVPTDDHLDNRRKDESKRGATDRSDQGYEETQFWYRLRQDKCDEAYGGTEDDLREYRPLEGTESIDNAGPHYCNRDVKLQGVCK